MREIRLSGSEGGGGHQASPYPYLSGGRYAAWDKTASREEAMLLGCTRRQAA